MSPGGLEALSEESQSLDVSTSLSDLRKTETPDRIFLQPQRNKFIQKSNGDSELIEISRNKMREIGCISKVDVISKQYGGPYN